MCRMLPLLLKSIYICTFIHIYAYICIFIGMNLTTKSSWIPQSYFLKLWHFRLLLFLFFLLWFSATSREYLNNLRNEKRKKSLI